MRFAKVLLGVAFVATFSLLGSVTASAAHVAPATGTGNPSCEGGLKIEPVTSGTKGGIVTLNVTGSTFSFTTVGDFLVTSVVVKGGPGYNLYSYPAPGVTSDTGLHAPANLKSGGFYGLSHLCFFGDDKKVPDPK
ncbi:hypothetical protein [Actinokineospora xionganensis]|uniref:Secreted protein n=1 Tax=Actinokineospora xionganensis TaxID=2684470 RepID=A0ABR7KZC0_9PSEU|nr:hypothetical protein [Actinokineospora xionganensis]MBC6445780.1 hypothetical protein [Actinokineospora xionganensis]